MRSSRARKRNPGDILLTVFNDIPTSAGPFNAIPRLSSDVCFGVSARLGNKNVTARCSRERGIFDEKIYARRTPGSLAIGNELSRSDSYGVAFVRIGGNPIYARTSTFVRLRIFVPCEAGD